VLDDPDPVDGRVLSKSFPGKTFTLMVPYVAEIVGLSPPTRLLANTKGLSTLNVWFDEMSQLVNFADEKGKHFPWASGRVSTLFGALPVNEQLAQKRSRAMILDNNLELPPRHSTYARLPLQASGVILGHARAGGIFHETLPIPEAHFDTEAPDVGLLASPLFFRSTTIPLFLQFLRRISKKKREGERAKEGRIIWSEFLNVPEQMNYSFSF
jgi:hypothetical protein